MILGVTASAMRKVFNISNLYISQISPRFAGIGSWWSHGVDVNSTGTKFIFTSANVDKIAWGTFTTAWNLYTFTYDIADVRDLSLDSATVAPRGCRFFDSDNKILIADSGNDGIMQFTLATTGDPDSTWTYNGIEDMPNTVDEWSLEVYGNSSLWVRTANSDDITEYSITTAGNVTAGVTFVQTDDIAESIAGTADNTYIAFKNSGAEVFYDDIETYDNNTLVYGTLSTPRDFSTITKAVGTKSYFPFVERIESFRWVDSQNSGFSASYNKDCMVKFREITEDTYEASKAYNFDGTTNDLIITNMKLGELGAAFTLVLRVSIPSGTTDSVVELAGSTNQNDLRWYFDGANNRIRVQLANNGTAVLVDSASSSFTPDSTYDVFMITYDTTNGLNVLLNGTSIATNSSTTFLGFGTHTRAADALFLMARENGGNISKGKISDAQCYDKVLNGTEISNLVTSMSNTTTNLVANWADQKGTYFWKDESGNAYHAGCEGVSKVTV